MKTFLLSCTAVLLVLAPTRGQQPLSVGDTQATVTDRGSHHRVIQNVTQITLSDGSTVLRTNTYTQIGTGICYQKDGSWLDSNPRFTLFPGGAVAQEGPFQLIISPDLAADGAVDILTPDSKRIRCSPRWLAYYDPATGQNQMIAAVKSCIGQLVDGNTILFQDAFDDILAAIRYTYNPSGVEQEIIFLDAGPLDPTQWGFNARNGGGIVLEMWSEFQEWPQPDKLTPSVVDGRNDVTLEFGQGVLGPGKAFALGHEEDGALVSKTWTSVDTKQFLIEAVRQTDLVRLLAKVPQQAKVGAPPAGQPRGPALPPRAAPKDRAALLAQGLERLRLRERRTQTASIQPRGRRLAHGVSLDFTVLASTSGLVLEAGRTYLVTNSVTLTGTTRIEPCIVKFSNVTNSTTARLTFNGPIDCQTDRYRPAIFTGKDDNSVGETITGSTGAPGTNRYALRVIELGSAGSPFDLHDLHIRYADKAFALSSTGVKYTVRHSQIASVNYGFYNFLAPCTTYGRNLLLSDALTGVFNSSTSTNHFEQVTFHGIKDFRNSTVGVVNATNCLFVCVTNTLTLQNSNCVASSLSDSGVFTNVGAGRSYLAANSPYRNAGTTNIDPALASDLKSKTTFPPLLLTSDFSIDTVLTPQAQRDTDVPDLGFEYDPIDYVLSGLSVTNATLALSNGAALAVYGASGLTLQSGAKFISLRALTIFDGDAVTINEGIEGVGC